MKRKVTVAACPDSLHPSLSHRGVGGGSFVYAYDAIGQLQTAVGTEADASTPRLHEQFGYGYDAAWNLNRRTNNALIQTFNTDNRNQLTTVTRTGSLAVGEDSYDRKG